MITESNYGIGVNGKIVNVEKKELQGFSTDIKPTNVGSGSTFYVLDKGTSFLFDAFNINPTTGDGWWEV